MEWLVLDVKITMNNMLKKIDTGDVEFHQRTGMYKNIQVEILEMKNTITKLRTLY